MTGNYNIWVYHPGDNFLFKTIITVEKQAPTKAPSSENNLVTYISVANVQQTMAVETGYTDTNSWVDWVVYSAKENKQEDCVACAFLSNKISDVHYYHNITCVYVDRVFYSFDFLLDCKQLFNHHYLI